MKAVARLCPGKETSGGQGFVHKQNEKMAAVCGKGHLWTYTARDSGWVDDMGNPPLSNGPRAGDLQTLVPGGLIFWDGIRSGHGLSSNTKDFQ